MKTKIVLYLLNEKKEFIPSSEIKSLKVPEMWDIGWGESGKVIL